MVKEGYKNLFFTFGEKKYPSPATTTPPKKKTK